MNDGFEKIGNDAAGWPVRIGSRVRVQPRPLAGCSTAPRSYIAKVVGSSIDKAGEVVLAVRAEKNGALRATRLGQVQVVKPRKPARAW